MVSSQKSFSRSFPEGTHYAKLVVTSGSQSETAIQSFYVSGECGSNEPCLKTAESTTEEASSAKQKNEGLVPTELALHAPAPNPVTSTAQITYDLPERTDVTLTLYDLMGRQVKQLATGVQVPRAHRVALSGSILSSGVYVVRLKAGRKTTTQRITVVE